MKIYINDIPPEGLSLDLKEEGSTLASLAGGLDFSFLSPVVAHLSVTRKGEDVSVCGDVSTKASLTCSRCIRKFDFTIETHFSVFFTRLREEAKERELKKEDMELNLLDGDEIDTDAILLEQIALEVPIKPLCSPECKGLCPRCGADLNQGRCGCPEEERIDPRFARLRDFKIKS